MVLPGRILELCQWVGLAPCHCVFCQLIGCGPPSATHTRFDVMMFICSSLLHRVDSSTLVIFNGAAGRSGIIPRENVSHASTPSGYGELDVESFSLH